MTKATRIIIGCGVLAFVFAGLYAPWCWKYHGHAIASAGTSYGWLWSPPMYGDRSGEINYWVAPILDLSRLAVEWVVIGAATVVLAALTWRRGRQAPNR